MPPESRQLGDFEIVRELGRGGMGVVYEARQVSLNRRVALKVLAAGAGLSGQAVGRFHREAQAAARLHHTNIVPVYATGEADGAHFYAMELIEGPSLDQVLRRLKQAHGGEAGESVPSVPTDLERTSPYVKVGDAAVAASDLMSSSVGSGGAYFDAVARMVADVADALDYAHKQNVLHRDVKPSNLMLSPEGRLSLTDFGLARLLEEPGLTVTGEFVGTPAYMSPEQITAGRVPVDHRTDVYSLGATLYELLTLQRPFSGGSRDQLLAQIIQKEPPRPRAVNAKVPVDLETICLKCLEKDPDRRYGTAGELAEDLRRYVCRFAIRARRAGPLTKIRKWVRRNPAVSALGLLVFVVAGAAGYLAWHAEESRRRALIESKQRDEEKRRAVIDRGMVLALAADFPSARAAIEEAEALGTSAGELHLLRGFVVLYSGETASAIKELRAAVEAMPQSTAAHALLAHAHTRAGDPDAGERVLKEAERLPVTTPEDRLFLGLALGPFDAPAALRQLRAAAQQRPSNIARVFLADALWVQAEKSGTIADAEAALDAAETATRLLPNNTHVEVSAVYARLAAAAAYDLANEPRKAAVHLDAGSRLADALSVSPSASAGTARLWLSTYRDGVTPPLPFTKRLRFPPTADPEVATLEVVRLWRLGHVAEARAVLAPLTPTSYTAQLKVALALEAADGREVARAAWAAAVGTGDEWATRLTMLPWLYLTGESDRAPVLAAQLRASGFRWRTAPPPDWDILLRFHEEKLTEADYLKAPASNRMIMGWRQWDVGMKRLGEGDREGARKAFTAVVEARTFWQSEWEWCHTFLIRMNTDPEWPKAIPMRTKKP